MIRLQSSATKGIAKIVSGSVLGQLVTLSAIPLIARLYSPQEVGTLTIITSFVFVGSSVAAGRYELAIPLPTDNEDARALTRLAIRFSILFGATGLALTAVAWLVTGQALPGLTFADSATVFLLCSLTGIFGALNYHAVRNEAFGRIAQRNLVRALAISIAQIGAAFTPVRSFGLQIGLIVGEALATATMARTGELAAKDFGRQSRMRRRREVARRYAKFPLTLAPSSLVNSAGIHGPLILIGMLHGDAVVGLLGMAQRAVSAPVSIVATAVSQVYISSMARVVRSNKRGAYAYFIRASHRLSVAALVIGIALLTVGPPILHILLGEGWAGSGAYVQALSPLVATQLLSLPVSQSLIVLQRTGLQLAWDIGRLTSVTVAILVPYAFDAGAPGAVWAYATASALMNLVAWDLSRRALKRYEATAEHD